MPPLAVLYEDGEVIVVDKPAGFHTAPLRPGESGTVLDMVIAAFPEVAGLPGVKPVEPGLVHRLDQGTSGCLVVARTAEAFMALRAAFDSEAARKHYAAVCTHAEPSARADAAVLRIESRFAPFGPGRKAVRVVPVAEERRRAVRGATGETYRTEAEILARASATALVWARIRKGFRHQVRAHLAFLGYPILGDPLYGAPGNGGPVANPAGEPGTEWRRMYLHAARIEVPHPATGAPLVVESPEPVEFKELFGDVWIPGARRAEGIARPGKGRDQPHERQFP